MRLYLFALFAFAARLGAASTVEEGMVPVKAPRKCSIDQVSPALISKEEEDVVIDKVVNLLYLVYASDTGYDLNIEGFDPIPAKIVYKYQCAMVRVLASTEESVIKAFLKEVYSKRRLGRCPDPHLLPRGGLRRLSIGSLIQVDEAITDVLIAAYRSALEKAYRNIHLLYGIWQGYSESDITVDLGACGILKLMKRDENLRLLCNVFGYNLPGVINDLY
jgi:hypothetical protein